MPEHLTIENQLTQLKAKWLCALRSGEYEQATGKLQDDGRYCCFGVLLKVAGYTDEQMGGCGTIVQVSPSLALDIEGPEGGDDLRVKLENMNDGVKGQRRCSFAEIADYIEANL